MVVEDALDMSGDNVLIEDVDDLRVNNYSRNQVKYAKTPAEKDIREGQDRPEHSDYWIVL